MFKIENQPRFVKPKRVEGKIDGYLYRLHYESTENTSIIELFDANGLLLCNIRFVIINKDTVEARVMRCDSASEFSVRTALVISCDSIAHRHNEEVFYYNIEDFDVATDILMNELYKALKKNHDYA